MSLLSVASVFRREMCNKSQIRAMLVQIILILRVFRDEQGFLPLKWAGRMGERHRRYLQIHKGAEHRGYHPDSPLPPAPPKNSYNYWWTLKNQYKKWKNALGSLVNADHDTFQHLTKFRAAGDCQERETPSENLFNILKWNIYIEERAEGDHWLCDFIPCNQEMQYIISAQCKGEPQVTSSCHYSLPIF